MTLPEADPANNLPHKPVSLPCAAAGAGGMGRAGYSLLEVLLTMAVIGVLAALGYQASYRMRWDANETKLQHDVRVLNQSILFFVANGGSLDDLTNVHSVLYVLKAGAAQWSDSELTFFDGSMLDHRTEAVFATEEEFESGDLRAYWNAEKQRFSMTREDRDGIRGFTRNPELSLADYSPREEGLEVSEDGGWIWDYDKSGKNAPPAPPVSAHLKVGNEALGGGEIVPQSLLDPAFSIGRGRYGIAEFDLMTAIGNPNSSRVSEIFYWKTGQEDWVRYKGPITVRPDDYVAAMVKSLDPVRYQDSGQVWHYYELLNTAPRASDDYFSCLESIPASLFLAGNDEDAEGDSLSVASLGGLKVKPGTEIRLPSGEVVRVGSNGNVIFNPGSVHRRLYEGESSKVVFSYEIADPDGETSPGLVEIEVKGVGSKLQTVPDLATVSAEGDLLGGYYFKPVRIPVLANDPSAEEAGMYLVGVEGPNRGQAYLDGNEVVFDPAGDFMNLVAGQSEQLALTYSAADQDGGLTKQLILLTVKGPERIEDDD